MKKIDLSIWPAASMPVAIGRTFGYATETVAIRGGTRIYIWLRVWKLGIEIALTRAAQT